MLRHVVEYLAFPTVPIYTTLASSSALSATDGFGYEIGTTCYDLDIVNCAKSNNKLVIEVDISRLNNIFNLPQHAIHLLIHFPNDWPI
jgi:hypothetical protein